MPGNQNWMLQQNCSKRLSKNLFYIYYFNSTILQLTVSKWLEQPSAAENAPQSVIEQAQKQTLKSSFKPQTIGRVRGERWELVNQKSPPNSESNSSLWTVTSHRL